MARPGEFSQRAFLNGKMDLAQAEAVADLISSETLASHRIAIQQMKGGFSKELSVMRQSLLDIVSLMELELDFSEEDVEFADRSRLKELLEKVESHISGLIESFKLGNVIKNGVPVAIVGATNTGKSTLLNAILGEERAIVSEIHGTTRDFIEDVININGVAFRFIDTAGDTPDERSYRDYRH
jgi:tRNA modification GTPase